MFLRSCVLGLSSTVLLMGCQTTPKATDEEKNAAISSYIECLQRAPVRLDDGHSSAGEVAVGIKNQCQEEYQRSLVVTMQGYNSAIQRNVNANMAAKQKDVEVATGVVLEMRARKAQGK
jgi:hypothetical protein